MNNRVRLFCKCLVPLAVLLNPNAIASALEFDSNISRFCSAIDVQSGGATKESLSSGMRSLNPSIEFGSYCDHLKRDFKREERLEAGAKAIEVEIESGRIDIADAIVASEIQNFEGQPTSQSKLRFELSRARLLAIEDRLDEALTLRTSIQDSLDQQFGSRSSESLRNRIFSANLFLESGQVKVALENLLAIELQVTPLAKSTTPNGILLERAIATALSKSGREGEAVERLKKLKQRLVSSFGESDSRVIDVTWRLSEVLTKMTRFEEALLLASNAYVASEHDDRAVSQRNLQSLLTLSVLYIDINRFESARRILEYVLDQIFLSEELQASTVHAEALSRLSIIEEIRGSVRESLNLRKRVYSIISHAYGENAEDTLIEIGNLASAMRRNGLMNESCQLLQDVTLKRSTTPSPQGWALDYLEVSAATCTGDANDVSLSSDQLESLKEKVNRVVAGLGNDNADALGAQIMLAQKYQASGKLRDAKNVLVRLLPLREGIGGARSGEEGFTNFASNSVITAGNDAHEILATYSVLARLHAEDGEFEEALRVSELARDRSLQDRFAREAWRSRELPAAARARLEPLRARLQSLEERIAVAEGVRERVQLESERVIAGADLAALEHEVAKRTGMPLRRPAPPSLATLQSRIPAGTALISILHSGDRWWALVVSQGEAPRMASLPGADLGVLAHAWKKLLRGEPVRVWPGGAGRFLEGFEMPNGATSPHLAAAEVAAQLGQALADPLLAASGGARRWVVVADDELVGVPLQALPSRGGFVGDAREIVYAPSLSTWLHTRERAATGHRHRMDLLALGDVAPAGSGSGDGGAQALPWSRAEVESIRGQFPADRVRAWLGANANKAALLDASRTGRLAEFRFVHFASHAWTRPDPPEASAISLYASKGKPGLGGAMLTAAELAGLSMGAELVVLSACDTGAGRYEHGRGLLGLAHASLAAGNRAALLSLWPVADDHAAKFMARFYALLRAGEEPSGALATVQREWAGSADSQLANPSVWAAFVLWGGA